MEGVCNGWKEKWREREMEGMRDGGSVKWLERGMK